MRQCRKVGLLTRYVRWIKHECSRKYESQGTYYDQDDEWSANISETTGDLIQGSPSYSVVWDSSSGQYVYQTEGQATRTPADATELTPAVLYEADGTKLYRYRIFYNGSIYVDYRTVHTYTWSEYVYYPGEEIGTVRAAEEEYPDERKGYSYVTTLDQGFIVMKTGSTYYAYLPVEITESTDGLGVALTNGVVCVTGAGSASIVDGVLIVSGDGRAEIEDGNLYTLYARSVEM